MKKNKLFAALFCAASCASVLFASTQDAVDLAADQQSSMESVCLAVANAVTEGADAPSQIFARVLSARESWTTGQLAGMYKSILMASDKLAASFGDDIEAFEAAGKPTSVDEDAPEGVKLLAVLYAANAAGASADEVIASVVTDTMGAPMLQSVSPLRDVSAGTSRRRTQPTKPTPPAASYEN